MTRILHISPTDIEGGACLGAYNLHCALRRVGADSHMLVLRKFGDDPSVTTFRPPLLSRLQALRDPLDRLPLQRYHWDRRNWFSLGWLPFDLRPAVDRIAPDLVQLHWVGRGLVPVKALAGLHNYPLVWTLRDMWPLTGGCHYAGDCEKYLSGCGACPQLHSGAREDVTSRLWRRKRRHWRHLPVTYVALSTWMAEQARRSPLLAGNEIVQIANGIDVERFRPTEMAAARAAWQLPVDRRIVLFGAMHALSDERKGFAYLAQALQQLAASGWGKQALLVVFGAEAANTDFGIPVRFMGQVRNDAALARLYSAADVMVTPSLYENAAKTVMEALACGTPVTAFANTGQFDLIDHGSCGYLAFDRSADDLAAGIEWCVAQRRAGPQIAQRARQKAVDCFDINAIARNHLSLYERLLMERRGAPAASGIERLSAGELLGPLLKTPVLGAREGEIR